MTVDEALAKLRKEHPELRFGEVIYDAVDASYSEVNLEAGPAKLAEIIQSLSDENMEKVLDDFGKKLDMVPRSGVGYEHDLTADQAMAEVRKNNPCEPLGELLCMAIPTRSYFKHDRRLSGEANVQEANARLAERIRSISDPETAKLLRKLDKSIQKEKERAEKAKQKLMTKGIMDAEGNFDTQKLTELARRESEREYTPWAIVFFLVSLIVGAAGYLVGNLTVRVVPRLEAYATFISLGFAVGFFMVWLFFVVVDAMLGGRRFSRSLSDKSEGKEEDD